MPKILIFDIETSALECSWGRLLSFGYMNLHWDKPKCLSISDYPTEFKKDCTNDRRILEEAVEIISEYDVLIGWYSKRFDYAFLQTRLLGYGMNPLPTQVTHIDLWETARFKLKLFNNRLQTMQEYLGLEESKTPLKADTWVHARAGDKASLELVREHCLADVLVTKMAYQRMQPFIHNHPCLREGLTCANCGGDYLIKRGIYVTRKKHQQRLQCRDCGAWTLGKIND